LIAGARSFEAFGRHLGVTDGHDLMLVSIRCQKHLKPLYCEFKKHQVMTMSVVGGLPKKEKKNTQIPVIRQKNTSNAFFYS